MNSGPATLLRWLARVLLRGPDAPFVIGDLEESFRRDLSRGMPLRRTNLRHLSNLFRSAAVLQSRALARAAHRIPLPPISLLDVKLGVRMLFKHPGLALVAGIAMAFAIWVGASGFELLSQFMDPDLGFQEDDRLVAVQLLDGATLQYEDRALFDFELWREDLESIEHMSAYRTTARTLVTADADGLGPPVTVAEITASGFVAAPVPPLMGRPLLPGDERSDAPPVALIGYGLWRDRFGSDMNVVGRSVLVGGRPATVIGVMPEGFAFPAAHSLWLPLREGDLGQSPGEGPPIKMFGRLAPGADLERAQSEVAILGERLSSAYPETHGHLFPRVMPYPLAWAGFRSPESFPFSLAFLAIASFNLPLLLFLVLVCGNVALLLFARAASRQNEILVRSALGATRARIVAQLFSESLVLGGLAALIGLVGTNVGLRVLLQTLDTQVGLPYWFQPQISPRTVGYALGLTLVASAVAGVLPGLKVSRSLGTRLKGAAAGGERYRFGGIWTVMIVSQIAVTVGLPVVIVAVRDESDQVRATDFGFEASEYLAVRLAADEGPAAAGAAAPGAGEGGSTRATMRELERRLEREGQVRGVTFGERVPWSHHRRSLINVEGPSASAGDYGGHRAASVRIDPDYFNVLGAQVMEGRGFGSSDLIGGGVVIVNQPFVENILQGQNAVGRRIRYAGDSGGESAGERWGPWLEIVGVVPDLGTRTAHRRAGIYPPAPVNEMLPPYMILQIAGGADAFASRLRALAAEVDPSLRLHDLVRIDRVADSTLQSYRFWSNLTAVVVGVGLLLSLAGIHAVMTFTVAQRTREIGVRVALGAQPFQVVREIFRTPLQRLALGILTGGGLMVSVWLGWASELPSPRTVSLFCIYLGFAGMVYLGACAVPTIRALRIHPSDALRADG